MILVQRHIDEKVWRQANWRSVGYAPPGSTRPATMFLIFEVERFARDIFESWQKRFGTEDAYEELRVSLIDGEIPGKEYGYTVHLTTDPLNSAKRPEFAGKQIRMEDTIGVSAMRRIPIDSNDTRHLDRFKQDVATTGVYLLAPAWGQIGALGYDVALGIRKRQIYFRHVSEIREQDLDFGVLTEGADAN
jgi:hypothetical protein